MPVDIGPKIGIDGERQFRQEIQQINQSVKTLASEAKSVEAAMRDETDAEKKNAAQKDILNRQILTQKEKLEKLEEGLKRSAEKYGEADVKTQKWQQAVYESQATLSNLESKLKGTDQQIEEISDDMGDAEKATSSWGDVMKGTLLADAVKAGLSKIADLAKSAASAMWDASKAGAAYADDILAMADTSGLSTDTLQEYKYMADLVDVSLDTMTGSMSKLTKTMSSAQNGTGEAADAFRSLGVDVVDSNGALRKAEDVFGDVVTALGKIDNETERDAKAMKIFGKSAQELNPLIKTGADRLNALRKEAHDVGYVLSGSALQALGKQQDAMDRLDKKAEALKNRFAVGLAPGVTKAADTMGEAFDNPRVQAGITALSNGIGDLIDGAANLAADILPDLFKLFTFGDDRLRLFADDELALANSIDATAEAHKALRDEFNENAEAIVKETKRTEDLWQELQTLVTEEGKVTEGNEARVDFILNQLNDALGTEYSRNGDLIEQYGTMKSEIGDLIKMREAEALLASASAGYADKKSNLEDYLDKAAESARKLAEAKEDLVKAQRELDEYKKETGMDSFGTPGPNATETQKKGQELENAARDAEKKIALLEQQVGQARDTVAQAYADVDRFERAQEAAIQGNYEEAIRLMTSELEATIDFYAKKGELSEADREAFAALIEEQEGKVEEYKLALRQGLTGFSEDGLREMELYVQRAKYILNGRLIGEMFVDGIVQGLENKRGAAYQAAWSVASSVEKAVKQRLEIASPSRVGDWTGQMWDEGMIRGLERKEEDLRLAAAGVADTVIDAGTPEFGGFGLSYGNRLTAAGAGYSSVTTNLGGITVMVDGAGAVDEDELAQRVAVHLTHELQRAQRGGRL